MYKFVLKVFISSVSRILWKTCFYIILPLFATLILFPLHPFVLRIYFCLVLSIIVIAQLTTERQAEITNCKYNITANSKYQLKTFFCLYYI